MHKSVFAFVSVFATTVSATGCSGALGAPDFGNTPLAVTRLRSEPFSFVYYSQLRQSQRLVIRDDASWQATWAAMWAGTVPVPQAPNVDFSKEMIVLAALGERNSGGYSILVDSATTSTNGVTVWIGTISPGAHCARTLALTQPVDIARLTRTDVPVHFTDVASVTECS